VEEAKETRRAALESPSRVAGRGGAGVLIAALLGACAAPAPIATVSHVDLERFMGKWYVIANIPTFIERGAHNAVESYRLDADGTIATTFDFRRGAFDGEPVEYTPRGFLRDASNAVWGMQFVWPFRAEYRIVYLAPDYSATIIGRSKRDYVWIMARTPTIPEADYARLAARVGELGYDVAKLERVPQRW
jgi:apolipoprotein D and lipocalin family protein